MNRVLDLLGLGQKGSRVVSGHANCLHKLDSGEARLLLLAGDASPGTRRRFGRLAEQRGVPSRECATQWELGAALGQSPRAVVVVKEDKLAAGIICLLDAAGPGE